MADVIKLTDKYIDTSSIYDTNQNKTQKDINSYVSNSVSSINTNVSSINTNISTINSSISSINTNLSSLPKRKVLSFTSTIGTQSAMGNYYTTLGTLSDYGLSEDHILSVSVGSWSHCAGCIQPYIQYGYLRIMSNVYCDSVNMDIIICYY